VTEELGHRPLRQVQRRIAHHLLDLAGDSRVTHGDLDQLADTKPLQVVENTNAVGVGVVGVPEQEGVTLLAGNGTPRRPPDPLDVVGCGCADTPDERSVEPDGRTLDSSSRRCRLLCPGVGRRSRLADGAHLDLVAVEYLATRLHLDHRSDLQAEQVDGLDLARPKLDEDVGSAPNDPELLDEVALVPQLGDALPVVLGHARGVHRSTGLVDELVTLAGLDDPIAVLVPSGGSRGALVRRRRGAAVRRRERDRVGRARGRRHDPTVRQCLRLHGAGVPGSGHRDRLPRAVGSRSRDGVGDALGGCQRQRRRRRRTVHAGALLNRRVDGTDHWTLVHPHLVGVDLLPDTVTQHLEGDGVVAGGSRMRSDGLDDAVDLVAVLRAGRPDARRGFQRDRLAVLGEVALPTLAGGAVGQVELPRPAAVDVHHGAGDVAAQVQGRGVVRHAPGEVGQRDLSGLAVVPCHGDEVVGRSLVLHLGSDEVPLRAVDLVIAESLGVDLLGGAVVAERGLGDRARVDLGDAVAPPALQGQCHVGRRLGGEVLREVLRATGRDGRTDRHDRAVALDDGLGLVGLRVDHLPVGCPATAVLADHFTADGVVVREDRRSRTGNQAASH